MTTATPSVVAGADSAAGVPHSPTPPYLPSGAAAPSWESEPPAPSTTEPTSPTPSTTTEPPAPTTTDDVEPEPVTEETPAPPSPTTPPPPEPTQPLAGQSPEAAEVVTLANEARAAEGCGALRFDDRLFTAAQRHSSDMASRDYFSHESPEGTSFVDRAIAAGHPSPAAENIAMGARSADQVMRMWLDSPGHRGNILNCDLTTIGVGLDTDGWYWTQVFGR
ncbi:Cysteine-rich secretory protein family protein [Actinoalloteichus hoggarensis]|uniref:Cysteine-rich secretory protein family protein n=2 Tax=Actinoalloteichus hoggarensis TaxID=1470176 RepID=A0A221W9U4_9PSEU|nr:Cysteine-rich secretory protein family protein [Actinoalloteichus hoggarensis]